MEPSPEKQQGSLTSGWADSPTAQLSANHPIIRLRKVLKQLIPGFNQINMYINEVICILIITNPHYQTSEASE